MPGGLHNSRGERAEDERRQGDAGDDLLVGLGLLESLLLGDG